MNTIDLFNLSWLRYLNLLFLLLTIGSSTSAVTVVPILTEPVSRVTLPPLARMASQVA